MARKTFTTETLTSAELNSTFDWAAYEAHPAKANVRVASTANVTLASGAENGDSIDGVTLATGDRILLKNQTNGYENGIYVVAASGAPTRATDADTDDKVNNGVEVYVEEGSTNGGKKFTLSTTGVIVLNTTNLSFSEFSGGGGGSLAWEGEWVTSTAYSVGDIVQNGSPVSSYRALTNHTSGATTEPGVGASWATNWEIIAEAGGQGPQGEAGLPGGSLDWKGDWVNATAYSLDDAVQDGTRKSSYRCKSAHTSSSTNRPGLGASWATYWTLIAQAGEAGAAGATGATGPAGANGINGVVWQGAWDSLTTYGENDGVSHDGSSYVCTASNTNQEPPNGSYWDLLAAEGGIGPAGPAGTGVDWKEEWSSGDGYVVNDALPHGSPASSYRCIADHTAGTDNEPGEGVDWADYWAIIAEAGSADANTLDGEDGAHYLDRANHTGTQAISTVTGLQTALDGKAASSHNHDDRYYTETEIDSMLEDFEPGGGGIAPRPVAQTGHGLSVGNHIRVTGNNTYAKAKADSAANAELAGYVTTVDDANNFEYLPVGPIVTGSGWTAGAVRFLDPSTAGADTATPPTGEGEIVKAVLLPINTTEAILLDYVGYAVPAEGGGGGDADTLEGEGGSYYRNRANHTGSQAISTVTGLQTALDNGIKETIVVAVSDEVTSLTTGTAKVTFRMPFAMTLTGVRASLATSSSSGNPTFDINENGSSILSTKLSIDSGEKTSTTAATVAVISDANLADDSEITIDIDTAGAGAKGAKITLLGVRA